MFNIDLKGKVAVVTASTNGIGLESALTLAKAGAKVYLAARNKETAQKIFDANKNLNLAFTYFDANNLESYRTCISDVYKIEKRIDILVNNYGGTNLAKDQTIMNTEYEDYMTIFERNLRSVFITSQEAIKIMIKEKIAGSIVNISTIGSVVPDISRIAYCTSKSAINSLTENMAVQVGKFGIRVNNVLPGLIGTKAALEGLNDEFRNVFIDNLVMKRIGKVEDIANMVLFLGSDLSTYITGETIEVAGGFGKPTPIYSKFYK